MEETWIPEQYRISTIIGHLTQTGFPVITVDARPKLTFPAEYIFQQLCRYTRFIRGGQYFVVEYILPFHYLRISFLDSTGICN